MKIVSRYDKTPWLLSEEETCEGVISGDWHIGDKYAPLPNQACTKEGQTVNPSKVQRKIKTDLIKQLKKVGEKELLIIPGDILEGKQLSAFGVPVSDSDTDTQVNWGLQFYEETFYKYTKPRYVLICMGTDYHASLGIGGNLDYQFADKIDELSEVVFGYPNLAFYLGKGKLLWDVRHRVSIASVNRLMPIEKTYRYFYREEVENNGVTPDVVGRAHNHSIVMPPTNVSMGSVSKYGWHSPCLKASDVYGEQLRYPSLPKLGFLTFLQVGERLYGDYYPLDVGVKGIQKI